MYLGQKCIRLGCKSTEQGEESFCLIKHHKGERLAYGFKVSPKFFSLLEEGISSLGTSLPLTNLSERRLSIPLILHLGLRHPDKSQ